MLNNYLENLSAKKGLEDLLRAHGQDNLWDVFSVQGFLGFKFVLKNAPADLYKEVWNYIKKNKIALRYYQSFPEDI